MARIKITGYFTPEPEEADLFSPTGLTEEAYLNLISGEDGKPLDLTDLTEVEVELQ
ncbi:hypothetical protein BJD78_gp98 [Arthrobacter phage KellEzio]|uniref:Uncharacterized protein n=1 Tax=Arthrobacter phage KellEzio TaxID=1796995 RepID=A0A140G6I3_9CAUD|nr:hypothetical protein BJD78_gp98 [Arthrobacter phage KellEzio]AMM44268.1 hypothetical protein KELLEZIO_98 [Arthrobacter phage KellEzio]